MFKEIPRDPEGKLAKLSKVLTLESSFVSPRDSLVFPSVIN